MSDDKNKKGPQDSSRINVHEDYEVQYWVSELRCSKEELQNAVKSVGVMVNDVREYLKSK